MSAFVDINESATLFFGLMMDSPLEGARESIYFESLSDAVRHAVETMDSDRRYDAYIETGSGARYDWRQIESLYSHITS